MSNKNKEVTIKKSVCSICSDSCGVDVWVKDGVIQKLEPSKGDPISRGQLCIKGYSGRDYAYRPDRIQTPLKRIGERGEGKFIPITWEQAYKEIAEKLLEIRTTHTADSVVFYSGFSKWYRPLLHRMAHSFGTLNYGSEASSCYKSYVMSSELSAGVIANADMMNSDLLIGWGYNPFHSTNYQDLKLDEFRKQGGKLLVIDPRHTPTAAMADLHLRPLPGTDGALACFFANHMIQQNKIDREYIHKYVYGFEEYKDYVTAFTAEKTSEITKIPKSRLLQAAEMIEDAECFSIELSYTALMHHSNGTANARAVMALSVLSGNFDRKGGNLPKEHSVESLNNPCVAWKKFVDDTRPLCEDGSGYLNNLVWQNKNPDFSFEGRKTARKKVGTDRFPVWSNIIDECQMMDFARNVLEEKPYPVKALFALGLNYKMFLENSKLLEAIKKLDFYVDVDLFMTGAARYADIVLPACSAYERSELIEHKSHINYVEPAIAPLYNSKSDADILCELASYLELEDPLLCSDYENICRHVLVGTGLTLEELKASPVPLKIPKSKPYEAGSVLAHGFRTPTRKYEIYSTIIEKFQNSHGLEPLPKYVPSVEVENQEEYPFILTSGGRIPSEFHSRLQDLKTTKYLNPFEKADLNPYDAQRLGIGQGDDISVETSVGAIQLKANLTHIAREGVVFVYQDYKKADVNGIISGEHLDPYSGYPSYRSNRCRIRKV